MLSDQTINYKGYLPSFTETKTIRNLHTSQGSPLRNNGIRVCGKTVKLRGLIRNSKCCFATLHLNTRNPGRFSLTQGHSALLWLGQAAGTAPDPTRREGRLRPVPRGTTPAGRVSAPDRGSTQPFHYHPAKETAGFGADLHRVGERMVNPKASRPPLPPRLPPSRVSVWLGRASAYRLGLTDTPKPVCKACPRALPANVQAREPETRVRAQ